jgi:hypothetical protein
MFQLLHLGKEIQYKGDWSDGKTHGAGVMIVSKGGGKDNVLTGIFMGKFYDFVNIDLHKI